METPPTTSEFEVDYIGVIPNENFNGLDIFVRTDFLRTYDRAKKNGTISSKNGYKSLDFRKYLLQVFFDKIVVYELSTKSPIFECSMTLISSCSSLSEDGITLFIFNIAPFKQNQNYFDFLVLALENEEKAVILSKYLNEKFTKLAEIQLQNISRHSKSLTSSLEASSPLAALDTPLTDSSHQSSVVSKAINEVLSCLNPEEVQHFREILRRYSAGEQNVKTFAQKLVELLGPGRKKRLSYLKHVLRSEDVGQFDSAIL